MMTPVVAVYPFSVKSLPHQGCPGIALGVGSRPRRRFLGGEHGEFVEFQIAVRVHVTDIANPIALRIEPREDVHAWAKAHARYSQRHRP